MILGAPNRRLETLQVHHGVVVPGLAKHVKRFGCSRSDLCTAILLTVFQSELVDSILDGDEPRGIASAAERLSVGEAGPRLRLPLRGRYQTVFDWLCQQGQVGSVVTVAHADMAKALDMPLATANSALQTLTRHGLIEQVLRGVRAKPGAYRVLMTGAK